MDRAIIEGLKRIIQEFLNTKGFDLVDFIYRYAGRDLVLRILVDKPEGSISLDECAYLNIEISRILDEKDILQARYILEVSSPGLDRPLKTKADFLRCINKLVKIFLNEPVNGKTELEGIISNVEGDSVHIDVSGEALEVSISNIAKAKQVINNV